MWGIFTPLRGIVVRRFLNCAALNSVPHYAPHRHTAKNCNRVFTACESVRRKKPTIKVLRSPHNTLGRNKDARTQCTSGFRKPFNSGANYKKPQQTARVRKPELVLFLASIERYLLFFLAKQQWSISWLSLSRVRSAPVSSSLSFFVAFLKFLTGL